MKKYFFPVGLWVFFEAVAVTFWLLLNNRVYLFNFTYIGTCLAVGMFLYMKKVKYARVVVQFAVGAYMLLYWGVLKAENMQLEGFWYFLFLGVFEAATMHYFVAKIVGPLFFGRGWCGYACWTAMVLDLLPYKTPAHPRKKVKFIPYLAFLLSLAFVLLLFALKLPSLERVMFWSFIVGNLVYYLVGIGLALALKDNRAFCKYICPITVFLKPASYFAVTRIKNDEARCVSCGKCRTACPMDVDMISNLRNRENGTDCILCLKCIEACPQKALHL